MSQTRRRQFLVAAGGLLASPLLRAQQTGRRYRVAIVLSTSSIAELAGPEPAHPLTRAILHELRALGYTEGRNLIFERRSAEGDPGRFSEIMAELIRLKTDAIILTGNLALVRVAQAATRRIPMVLMAGISTAVEEGFAASLARPGGNITGFAEHPTSAFEAKVLQLFKEVVPGMSRVAYLGPRISAATVTPLTDAAAALGINLLPVVQHQTDPEVSFAAISQLRADGLLVAGGSVNYGHREQLGRLALTAQIPAISSISEITETGGLISYGQSSLLDRHRRIAHFVDRILKGANPGDLPMELPTKYNMVINLKTAKALGLTIPSSILVRADRVIE